ncbi:uncharacterized protein NPIL_144021 [Nephila pilipes]|uniref:Reverse transcriptase domain-containing protein n=1 Tax=Nephila pilipes TaxID=299642 RepID=A0A8X6MPI0_NEPPI|nr:uncharacterized protein NPIL_144021 [Nephila pilipes]
MEILNRSRSTLKGKISRIETFIKSAYEETDSVQTKVKLKNVIALQRNIEELRNNYYSIPNVKDTELASIDEEINLLEERLEKLEPFVLILNKLSYKSVSLTNAKMPFDFSGVITNHVFIKSLNYRYTRFNRVNFGVSSSPFLLAAMIRHHIEKYKHEFPDTVELLDRSFYVDDLISGGNEFQEALQTSRRAKYTMEAAGMDLKK